MKQEIACEAVCIVCGRSFWVTEEYLEMIKKGEVSGKCDECEVKNAG